MHCKAIEVAPDNSRARTVLGYTQLIRLEVTEARGTFSRAVSLDPGDPLPHLGLGLATIRKGRLVDGREHIEVAAALDPNNALVRSYLGKAYAEEREPGNASEQFELAKQLDPEDPTPWFYDALLAQSLNRPVEAYRLIEKARILNDSRLVYQSRLLLDKDKAAGSLSLARIYTDLGFEQPAVNESTRSISVDSTNYSAYRLLADSYAERERLESARRNVLFQAALLQPLTINPVQPDEQETDLLTLPGTELPAPAIREYSPLFERQGLQIAGTIEAGDKSTFGDNLVISGLHESVAYGLGHLHYETDGAAVNADIEHNVYHSYIQGQISPTLFLQADIQRLDTEEGDFVLNFNPESLTSGRRVRQEATTPRVSLRANLTPRSTMLIAARAIDRTERILEPQELFDLRTFSETEGFEAFARFIHRADNVQQTFGVDAHELDLRSTTTFEVEPCPLPTCVIESGELNSSFVNYYYYAYFATRPQLRWTLGLSYSTLDDEEAQINNSFVNPKFGLRWRPSALHEFRLVVSSGLKGSLTADLTLEPTTIAGFNQVRDDFAGTRFIDSGIAYDVQLGSTTLVGFELLHRELDVPVEINSLIEPDGTDSFNESQHETMVRGYWNRTINKNLSLGLSVLLEQAEREGTMTASGEQLLALPLRVETASLPFRVNFNHPSGFFAQSEISYVYQSIELASGIAEADVMDSSATSHDDFTIIDVSLGLRLPKRRVTFRLDVNNLLDEAFLFQGGNIRSAEPSSSRFSPSRTVVGRVSFSF